MADNMKELIREFIINNFMFGDSSNTLADGDSLLEKGIIDSTGILELVAFIEEEFAFKVEDEELIPDNLDSLNHLEAFISRKKTP